MRFCVVRLGKNSVDEILEINTLQGINLPTASITIKCKQVPVEVDAGSFCLIWLGSDNNKGLPTIWKQGLRAIGTVESKWGGENYMDEVSIKISVGIVFHKSINKTELLKSAGLEYIDIANIPVIGLSTSSNQTVQLIRTFEEGQNISVLLRTIVNNQSISRSELLSKYPELDTFIEIGFKSKARSEENTAEEIERTDESNVQIKVPFDPNLIKLRRDPYTLGELIDRIEHDEINFFTGFQRKADLWDSTQQSRLIESILLRLPLPAFYFDETDDNKWQVIDGLQRTSVFKNFIVDKSLELGRLEFLREFNGKRYDELPRDLIRRIKTTPLMVYVIEKGTPDEVKFNIFKRINTGGLVLAPQEIRHALNQGVPSRFVEELAKLDEFKGATCYVIKTDRMEDRDFVTRFTSFYLIPFFLYEPDLDSFMNKGMSTLKNTTLEFRQKMKDDFIRAMNTAVSIFGDDAFRKRHSENERRRPLNKAIFESISVCFSQLSLEENAILLKKGEVFRKKFIGLNHDDKFASSISSGTGQQESVLNRFSQIKEIVYQTINDE